MIPKSDAEYLRYLANKTVEFGDAFDVCLEPYTTRLRAIADYIERYENIITQQAREIGVLVKANMSDKESGE